MKILITAGSTWVKIDAVRILTNRFTGRTGVALARALAQKKHRVTLLVNPHCVSKELKGLLVEKFYYFTEFKQKIISLLKKQKFDLIIHTAAVSDYVLPNPGKSKIPSGKPALTITLKPTEKIIKIMRRLVPAALIMQFKLEEKKARLLEKAYASLLANGSDFVVANALEDLKTKYLINRAKHMIKINSLQDLAANIHKILTSLVVKK